MPNKKKSRYTPPTFQWSFFLPKYWLAWLTMGFLYLISWLPYGVQMAIGRAVGRLLMKVMKSRKKVAERNLQLCFPEMSDEERDKLVKRNFENTGCAMLESGMAWWWPNWRVNPKVTIKGREHVDKHIAEGKGVLGLFIHALPMEMLGRAISQHWDYAGYYRPHNNALIEWVQHAGRSQGKNEMIGKQDVKALLSALSRGKFCIYLPDHDYGKKRSVFAPLFAVEEAATTTGTDLFASHKNAVTVPTIIQRLPGNQGYEVEFLPEFKDFPDSDPMKNAVKVNAWVEQAISTNVEQYMWVHRRFKTRPEHSPESLYKK